MVQSFFVKISLKRSSQSLIGLRSNNVLKNYLHVWLIELIHSNISDVQVMVNAPSFLTSLLCFFLEKLDFYIIVQLLAKMEWADLTSCIAKFKRHADKNFATSTK